MSKKCILVWGYWAGNLGDDLFLYTLCKRYPNSTFIIICELEYAIAFKNINNLIVVQNEKNLEKDIYLQIYLGGSLFMQPHNERDIETKFLNTTKNNLFNTPYIVIGANFGPYNKRKHLQLYYGWFKKANNVCFRDGWSRAQFESLNNIRWAPDLILGKNELLDNLKFPKRERIISISLIKKNGRIGLPNYSEENYKIFIVNAILKYIKYNYKIQLLSFCPKQGDTLIANEILELITPKYRNKILIIEYKGDIANFIINGFNCDYLIGTRFHSAIIAWKFNRKVLPIIYNDKMKHALNDYNFPYHYVDIADLNNISFEFVDYNRLRHPWNCETLKAKAMSHFDYLDTIIGGEQ